MPSRFLNNININDEYSLPNADGSADQIITTDGAGQLSFVDQSTLNSGSAERTEILVKNLEGSALSKGDPVYIIGSVGASERLEVGLANAGDADKMPCVGLLTQDLAINGEGTAIVTGKLKNLVTSPIDGATPTENDTIYVKSGGGLTLTKPAGSTNLIQNVGQVGRVSTSSDGNIVVSAILRTNDVPNLTTGKIWVGSAANTIESATVHLDETNGRMGIGTPSPQAKLHVDGAIRVEDANDVVYANKFFTVSNAHLHIGANTGYDTVFFNGPVTERMRITSTGNVGIGTTGPGAKLDVNGAGNFSGGTVVSGIDTNTNVGVAIAKGDYLYSNDGNYLRKLIGQQSGGSIDIGQQGTGLISNINFFPGTSGNIDFFGSGSIDMRVASSGNVGIGTTSPGYKLEVNGTFSSNAIWTTASNLTEWGSGTTAYGTLTWDIGYAKIFANSGNQLQFAAGGASTDMTIDTSGNVGIGTTSPNSTLEVSGNIDANGGDGYLIETKPWANWASDLLTLGDWDGEGYSTRIMGSNSSEVMRVTGTSVGIGTTSPDYKLEVNGTLGVSRTDGIIFAGSAGSGLGNKITSDTSNNLIFSTSLTSVPYTTTERVRILNNGNVGIGTTSPTSLLTLESSSSSPYPRIDIKSTSAYAGSEIRFLNSLGSEVSTIESYDNPGVQYLKMQFNRTTTGGKLELQDNTAILGAGTSGSQSYSQVGITDFRVVTNYSTRMYVNTLGNVGIGTTSPGAKLDIINTGGSSGSLADCQTYSALTIKPYSSVDSKLTFSANGVSTQLIQATNNAGTNGRQISLQPFSGDVGVGVILPSEKLDVNGYVKASSGYKGYVSHFHSGGFDHIPRSTDGANPFWIPSNYVVDSTVDQYYNIWVPLYAGRIRKIILKNTTGTPTATVCTFYKRINGTTSGTTYAGTVTGGGASGMKVTVDFGISNFTFNAEDEIQIGFVTGVATQPSLRGVSYQIWYEYNIT